MEIKHTLTVQFSNQN